MSPEALKKQLDDHRRLVLVNMPDAGLAYYLSATDLGRPALVVTADDDRAAKLAADLQAWGLSDVLVFPGEEHVPFEDASPDLHAGFQRAAVRYRFWAGEPPTVVVVTANALQTRWMPAEAFGTTTCLWVEGDEVSRDAIAEQLIRCGYQRVNFVEDPGTFAVRGSIVDIYPPDQPRPIRLDLFGDDIASLKPFDPDTQKTYAKQESLTIFPLREVVFDPDRQARAVARLRQVAEYDIEVPSRRVRSMCEEIEQGNYFFGIEGLWPAFYDGSESVLDTLLSPDTLVVVEEAEQLETLLAERAERSVQERQRRLERHDLVLEVDALVTSADGVGDKLAACSQLRVQTLADDRHDRVVDLGLADWGDLARELAARRDDASRGEILDPLAAELKKRFEQRYEVVIACGNRGNAQRLRDLLIARKIDLPLWDALPPASRLGVSRRQPRRGIAVASLSAGIRDPERRVAVLTDVEIFGTVRQVGKKRRRPSAEGLSTLRDLSDGDLVIHVDHGIGRYLGLKRLILNGVDGDYVHLEYAGDDKLYLPVYRLNLLQTYQGSKNVKLDKLGGTRWEKAKQRVKDAVQHLAHKLLALQAQRRALPGFALPPPTEHFRAFEATFPYEETPDQQKAIDDVLADLQKDTPTDRLVCGDVGFGKTEVAIRAAFLAISGGRQVAVLVPTTVLAEQHGNTFRERLHSEAVNVEVINRFRSPKEVRDILQRLKEGRIDVLVGTHRLLSADVHFHNLGLLVVDEEQRFGVKHKERIKELRAHVHVLTLSATPIPRTLHMAMVGVRDLSLIQTAPVERMSIKTEVTRFDETVVAEAIRRELHRGGQVFVVHNRVQSIGAMASLVERLIPEARIAAAHGQMTGEELEGIMVRFIRREVQVLVCTAIIESGIDIPSANTMIVNRADTFGLAQLHQLRGRIGRGKDRAYAYLLLPRSDKVTKDAAQRLSVLKRFSELGSGFQIASHDLDIRGAGDLLGSDQSGSIAAVGFELYTELLGEAVERAKGQVGQAAVEPEIQLPVPAVVPEDYVPQPMQRLAFYQRMAQAESDEGVFEVMSEIESEYGQAPEELDCLAEVMLIRRRLKALGVSHLSGAVNGGAVRVGLSFVPDAPLDRADLAARMQSEPERYRLLPSGRLAIFVAAPDDLGRMEFLRSVRGEVSVLKTAA